MKKNIFFLLLLTLALHVLAQQPKSTDVLSANSGLSTDTMAVDSTATDSLPPIESFEYADRIGRGRCYNYWTDGGQKEFPNRMYFYTLDIHVTLDDDGTAHIVEKRHMNITSIGSECYIVIGNLNGSEIKNLSVVDENGVEFTKETEDWDPYRPRSKKVHRCGIHLSTGGYEICWGLGEEGDRTYTVSYDITKVVKGYDDYDGFNFMWVAENIDPSPFFARIIIEKEGTPFDKTNCGIWAFRYEGAIQFYQGKIIADTWSEKGLGSAHSMITLVRFNKGIFTPADRREGETFAELQEIAFEGSDYEEWAKSQGGGKSSLLGGESTKDPWWMDVLSWVLCIGGGIILVLFCLSPWLPFALLIGAFMWLFEPLWKLYHKRKTLKGGENSVDWYREIPMNGGLVDAYEVLNELTVKYGDYDRSRLVSAGVMRLIYQQKITLINEKENGEWVQRLMIEQPKDKQPSDRNEKFLHRLQHVLYDAAGKDHIIQPKEIKTRMMNGGEKVRNFSNSLLFETKYSSVNKTDAKLLYGLKKFLREFSLSDERHVRDVNLWHEYLVYATLFGNADQVSKDMAAICPEYLKMDALASNMITSTAFSTSLMDISTFAFKNAKKYETKASTSSSFRSSSSSGGSRSWYSGGGGRSSSGGGGGYSGGGSGGGVR